MATKRLEVLTGLAARNPSDNRTRYMLAMELGNTGDPEAAVKEFETIIAADADYAAAYYPCGQMLRKLGRTGEARSLYERGIEACTRTQDEHAKDRLRTALDALA